MSPKLLLLLDANKSFSLLACQKQSNSIDRAIYQMRPDLKVTGRTLVGKIPARHQQLEDHYFGAIPSRVTATIGEVELELFRLGVPLKTRHNEVFELVINYTIAGCAEPV
jgi:glutamine synthetase